MFLLLFTRCFTSVRRPVTAHFFNVKLQLHVCTIISILLGVPSQYSKLQSIVVFPVHPAPQFIKYFISDIARVVVELGVIIIIIHQGHCRPQTQIYYDAFVFFFVFCSFPLGLLPGRRYSGAYNLGLPSAKQKQSVFWTFSTSCRN